MAKEAVKVLKIPAWTTVTGTVTAVEKATLSFVVLTSQYVSSISGTGNLHVRGRLEESLRWRDPIKRLPAINGQVHFEGILEEVETTGSNAQPVVLLDFIVYLGRPTASATEQTTEGDDEKIMELAQQFSQPNDDEGAPSAKKLGKRKMSKSDEEVAGELDENNDHDSADEEDL